MAQKEIQRMELFKYMFGVLHRRTDRQAILKKHSWESGPASPGDSTVPCGTSVALQLGEVSLRVSFLLWLSDELVFPEHLLRGSIVGRPDDTSVGVQVSLLSEWTIETVTKKMPFD